MAITTDLVYRANLPRPLTSDEVDDNFRKLVNNDAELQIGVTQAQQSANSAQQTADAAKQSADGKQPASPKLSAIASAVWAANSVLMASGANTLEMLATGSKGRSILATANEAEARTAIGLANVNNTSDADKPVSTAQQAVFDQKLNIALFNFIGYGGNLNRAVPNDDCNQATDAGWYSAASGTAANRPPAMTFPLIHNVIIGGYIVQRARDLFTGREAGRAFNVGDSTWSLWQREAFLSDLGTSATRDSVVSLTDPTPGRVMTVGSGGLLGESPRVTNLNTLLKGGSYSFATGATGAPSGENFGTVFVEAWDANNVTQQLKTVGEATSRVYLRNTANAGTTWGPWVRYTSENGSNANGRYTKFSDGTLICEGFIDLPAMAASTSVSANAAFAMAFSSPPRVVYNPIVAVSSGSQSAIGLVLGNGPYSSATAEGWTLNCYAYRSATDWPVRFSYIAYGRWF